PESGIVLVLLNGSRQNSFHSDAITAHDRSDFSPSVVEHSSTHRLGISVSQLENVADLDSFCDLKRSATIRTGFPGFHRAQIHPLILGNVKVTARRDVPQVVVLFICPRDQVFTSEKRTLDQNLRLDAAVVPPLGANGTKKARWRMKYLFDLFRVHGTKLAAAQHTREFCF